MQLPYTVKAKKAIDIAGKMSKSLHHNYIGTEPVSYTHLDVYKRQG